MLVTMDQKGSTMNIDLRSPALNWINGEWVDSAQHTESINPATGEVIGKITRMVGVKMRFKRPTLRRRLFGN